MQNKTIQEIADEVIAEKLSPATIELIVRMEKHDMYRFHSNIGRAIRDEYQLDHLTDPRLLSTPDEVSMNILHTIWDRFHYEPVPVDSSQDDADKALAVRALNEIDDLVSAYMYYDRKEDDNLKVGDIEDLVIRGKLSIAAMVDRFETCVADAVNLHSQD